MFNDNINNGLVYYSNESFTFPSNSYSMVISFQLLKTDNKTDKGKRYCVFSISEADNYQHTKFVIFLEDKKLKIMFGEKRQEILLFNNIKNNQ